MLTLLHISLHLLGMKDDELKKKIISGYALEYPKSSKLENHLWDTVIRPCFKKDEQTRLTFHYIDDHIANYISIGVQHDYAEIAKTTKTK